jgi:hypothetical protein
VFGGVVEVITYSTNQIRRLLAKECGVELSKVSVYEDAEIALMFGMHGKDIGPDDPIFQIYDKDTEDVEGGDVRQGNKNG